MDIHIKNVQNLNDLMEAIEALTIGFHEQPKLLRRDEFTLVKAEDAPRVEDHTEPFSNYYRVSESAADGYAVVGFPRPLELGPIPCPEIHDKFVPCPQRGEHLRLVECWACWSDVHRGAVVETDVLAEAAWTAGLSDLVS